MKHVSIAALSLALALSGVAAGPAPAKDKPAKETPVKYTPAVQNALAAAQKALTAGDNATATAKIAEAKAAAQTDDDRYATGSIEYSLYQKTKDATLQGDAIDLMVASGKGTPEQRQQVLIAQGQIAYLAKDYRKAQTAMQGAYDAGATDPVVVPALIESMRLNGQSLAAMQMLNAAVAKAQAAGQPVPNEWFQRGFSIAYQAKPADPNFAAIRQSGMELNKKWVVAEPKGVVWHDVVLLYRESVPQDIELKIDVNRLLLASNGLQGGNDYLEYAENVYQRYPGEAKAVLDAGVGKGVLTLANNRNAQEINQIAGGKVAADKASLPGSEKAARAAATGKGALTTADAYLGYGDYAKAIDLYTLALSKGGVDANIVNIRIGVAQFRSGDKAGAKTTFAKVTGPRKDLADLWTVLIDHPATA